MDPEHTENSLHRLNAVFVRVLDAVADLVSFARRQTEPVPGAVGWAMVEREAIYCALEQGDAVRARRATIIHSEEAAA